MMIKKKVHKVLTLSIATVWIVNGLFCKMLHLVPRHEEIVQSILSLDKSSSHFITFLIGLTEVVMAIWILIGYKTKLNALSQITIVATMNTLEFILVPDLLLWGKLNSLFAFLFILVVYFNEFYIKKQFN
jgi:uncharacterized membrane protein YphA (DoxX/SURF4 family)